MDKVLKGVLRYNKMGKSKFLKEFKQLGENWKPHTVMVSCMDSRVMSSKFADTSTGDMFIVRNAGNMVPHYQHYKENNMVGTEGAGFELGVILNQIQNVVVCGHSDCKAVNTLYSLSDDLDYLNHKDSSALKTWITLHGKKSIEVMRQSLPVSGDESNNQPLVCSFNISNRGVTAKIDPTNNFSIHDKLSQLHCLQQASHFSSYPFLSQRMDEGKLKVHAMWFDIHKGDVYIFSPKLQTFVLIDDVSSDSLLKEVQQES